MFSSELLLNSSLLRFFFGVEKENFAFPVGLFGEELLARTGEVLGEGGEVVRDRERETKEEECRRPDELVEVVGEEFFGGGFAGEFLKMAGGTNFAALLLVENLSRIKKKLKRI